MHNDLGEERQRKRKKGDSCDTERDKEKEYPKKLVLQVN